MSQHRQLSEYIEQGMGSTTGESGCNLWQKKRFFSFPQNPDQLWGSSSLLPSVYQGALSLQVKLSEHEADHSLLSGGEIKNVWNYTNTPTHVFMAWCLTKHKDRCFTFTFIQTSNFQLHPVHYFAS
jgi:hypothetical protein